MGLIFVAIQAYENINIFPIHDNIGMRIVHSLLTKLSCTSLLGSYLLVLPLSQLALDFLSSVVGYHKYPH